MMYMSEKVENEKNRCPGITRAEISRIYRTKECCMDIEKALEYYTNISAELERINENMSNVALSSAVKHSYISAAYAYLDFTAES